MSIVGLASVHLLGHTADDLEDPALFISQCTLSKYTANVKVQIWLKSACTSGLYVQEPR